MIVARCLKFGLAALVALAASVFFAAPALAETQPDPQLTNIPYLAWRGEEVRLVKCEPDVFPGGLNGAQVAQSVRFGAVFVDFLLVDWSGDPHLAQPQLEPGTVSMFFRSFDGAPCVAGTFISQKAGLAQIKLVATLNFSQADGFPSDFPEVISLKHDFNVAWMNINTARLAVTARGTTDIAGGAGNELQVLVDGTIPLLQNYGELGLGDSLTMPNDWAALANAMATFRDPLDPNPAFRWDIHDEFSPAGFGDDLEGHGNQSECPVFPIDERFDAVDSCVFGGEDFAPFGNFSRIWDDYTFPTLGPFDPQRPSQTYLSNGVLDSGDAPMPAARVDWTIAPNSGAAGDISGVGSLVPRPKFRVYREDTAHAFDPGNPPTFADEDPNDAIPLFYGPFYAQWIPPTAPSIGSFFGGDPPLYVPEASGITAPVNFSRDPENCDQSTLFSAAPVGVGGGNNFNGYLACGLYINWLFAKTLQCGPGGFNDNPNEPFGFGCEPTTLANTGCLPVVANFDEPLSGADVPTGAQTTVAYTDEHGEARVQFSPGTEFFFLQIPGVAINSNGGCDLANIPGGILGTANISAVVRYPFEPVTARPVVSNTVTKTVTSLFSKTITCYPKGTQAVEQRAAICVAQATDITGAPFVGETVCFMADFNAEDIQPFPAQNPGIGTVTTANPPFQVAVEVDSDGNVIGPIPDNRDEAAEGTGLRRICMITDDNGRAAVEIFNSNPTTVDVTALFVDEGILRHLIVPFPITGQVGPASAASSNTTDVPGGSQNSGGSQNTGGSPSPGTNNPDTASPAKYRIAKFKVNRIGRTKATVLIRVNGPQGRVPVRIRFAAKGKQARTVTRAVKTNRLVKLSKLRTPNAKRLRASVSLVS